MSEQSYDRLEERVAALEAKLADRDATIAFLARSNSLFLESTLGVKPLSECESNCIRDNSDDTQARLNCMLKCVADGK